MINLLTKLLMALSFLYYGTLVGFFWFSALVGWHNGVWESYGLPAQANPPPTWLLALALLVTVLAFACLGYAYRAVWQILDGGSGQDFRMLARHLHRLSLGLVGFWIGYSFVNTAMRYLLLAELPQDPVPGMEMGWDFLDTEIIYLILPAAIYAVSKTLERAGQVEDEVSSFL